MSSPGRPGGTPERPALFFDGPAEFAAWLEANHATAPDLWMGLRKKHVVDRGLTWEDAVVEALCWGWIDSRVERIDEDAVRQRWTPRRPGSSWSRINIAAVERLKAEGRMQPSGLAVYEARKQEASGYTHEAPADVALPPAYAEMMAADAKATAFWEVATPSYRKICIVWVTGAKQQATNDRRMAQLLEDHAAGRMIPSQRYGEQPKWVERAAEAAARA
ncbi:YdeI/OmpD-associated family protein [Nocardioides jiangxiensis]|uniref:YdeI/OmpD-associated family protein n=1 Tax=Nocardioides jiangxiensis TaxID=3064524 RepID=A0ABT9B1Y7_9ACTN|nr:YdeI/OmpD-associated family protein [Nocardioides sp. WY-20]MDO7868864.1 YdeI/OmpD-associated family protein [Nocardioides sp. WY-20]